MVPNSRTPSPCAVVVGVDGSPGALLATRWAAVEAACRNLPLRLVFAVDPASDAGGRPQEVSARSRVRFAEDALMEAEHQARRAVSAIEVTFEVVHEPPAPALVHGVARSAMICLGSNGIRLAHPGHRTGTATEVLLTADCPVAVIRGSAPDFGWVVVTADPEPTLFDTLGLAVNEAVLRGLSLRVLLPWSLRDARPGCDLAELDRRLRHDLDRWRRQYPHLEIVVVGGQDLDDFLIRNARHISLFVAPARSVHDVGTVIHPGAESAIELLDCPVLINAQQVPSTGHRGVHRHRTVARAQGPGA